MSVSPLPPPPPPPPPPCLPQSPGASGQEVGPWQQSESGEGKEPGSEGAVAESERTCHCYERDAVDPKEELAYLTAPLLATNYGAQTAVEPKAVAVLITNANPVIQRGPTCGLVALTMAARLLKCDQTVSQARTHPEALLDFARSQGISKHGEMFSACWMLRVAREQLKCRGALHPTRSLSPRAVMEALVAGKAILFPYDADKNHSPCLAKGHKAHWCVLVGFALVLSKRPDITDLLESCCSYVQLGDSCSSHESQPGYYAVSAQQGPSFLAGLPVTCKEELLADTFHVFARQGKSRHVGLWSYGRLLESNMNLSEVDPRKSPDDYVIPDGGIAEGLCSQALVLESLCTEAAKW